MVGYFIITASLDHLDYDCVVVAGSVHVLGGQEISRLYVHCSIAEHTFVTASLPRPIIRPQEVEPITVKWTTSWTG